MDRFTAKGTVRGPDPAEKEPQVIIDFGDGADGRPGIVRDSFLLDRNGWGQAGDVVYVWFVEYPEELARIGREGLDISSLPLGENRVEG